MGRWEWGAWILAWAVGGQAHAIPLGPENILIAEALPLAWEIPDRVWHTLRAILCWTIWKDRNNHVFGGERSDVQRMIGISWHRLSLYVNIAWKDLIGRCRRSEFSLDKAKAHMVARFVPMGRMWTLHEVQFRVLPVPPRPP